MRTHADILETGLSWAVFALLWAMIRSFHMSSLLIMMLHTYEVITREGEV